MSGRINTIEAAKIFQTQLDELAVQSLVTGFMEQNTDGIKYTGGDEIKIPDIDMDGQADYNRNTGYVKGAVNVSYQTLKMTQDRGRKFYLDAMEVDESNFIAESSRVMSKYQKTKVVPEIDAYRISKLANYAMGVSGDTQARYGYTLDGCPLIYVPSNRMYSSIQVLDGTTSGQEQGGYKKADDAKNINFVIVDKSVSIAVTKQDVMRIFEPTVVQDLNSWQLDYRRFHDLWVLKNQMGKIYVNVQGDK